jgi:hypothetical protein
MSDYNDTMFLMSGDRPDRHSFIESAEVLGPVFAEPIDYRTVKQLGESKIFADLSALAAERSKQS